MKRLFWKSISSLFAKVDLSKIFKDHTASLKRKTGDGGKERYSLQDIFVFFLLPLAFGVTAFLYIPPIRVATYNTSISVFSVFGALLFSAQVAMFGLLRKSSETELSEADKNLDDDQKNLERSLLIEVNASISYLIALSCISISGLLILSALHACGNTITGIICTLYSHFFLTAAMLIKRSHALFDNAYKRF